jgi:hypothetical protein
MRPIQFVRQAVMDDGGADYWVVFVAYACARKELAQIRKRLELLHRVTAVSVADAVVRPCDVVKIHSDPLSP